MDDTQVCEGCGGEFAGGGLTDHDGRKLCGACIQDEEGFDLSEDEDDDDVDSDLVDDDEDDDYCHRRGQSTTFAALAYPQLSPHPLDLSLPCPLLGRGPERGHCAGRLSGIRWPVGRVGSQPLLAQGGQTGVRPARVKPGEGGSHFPLSGQQSRGLGRSGHEGRLARQ